MADVGSGSKVLEIRKIVRGDIVIIELRGRLDSPYETQLTREIQELHKAGIRKVVIDCSEIEYLSSRGLSAFIAVLDELRADGGDLKLVGLKRQAHVVFDRLGISALIQTFPYIDAAFQSFSTPISDFLGPTGLSVFIAASNSKVFHVSGCLSTVRISQKLTYPSKNLARKAGLRPCKRCLCSE